VLAVPTSAAWRFFVILFKLNHLFDLANRNRPAEERIHMQVLADAIGVPRSTLAGLASGRRETVTNTATLEGIARFFSRYIPDFNVSMLLEFEPILANTQEVRVDLLYPLRTRKGVEYRRRVNDENGE
jgi:transcriptional regulator with XRE-family HTH domain